MGYLNQIVGNGNGSSERGPRGIAGRGIQSITTQDNNNGSINLTISYDDGTPSDTFVNSLVSDTLIQLDRLTLEGSNNEVKFMIKQQDETVMFKSDTANGINFLKNIIIGNSNKKLGLKDDEITFIDGSGEHFKIYSETSGSITLKSFNELSQGIVNIGGVSGCVLRQQTEPSNDYDLTNKLYVDTNDAENQVLVEQAQIRADEAYVLAGTAKSIGENANANAFQVEENSVSKILLDPQTILSDIIIQGSASIDKFVVKDDANNEIISIDTLNNRIRYNGSLSKNGEIVFLDTPINLPVGIPSSVNMKLNYDSGGVGDVNFVGYTASNGPNSMYNLVNNASCGLFFVAPSTGIQTSASYMSISSQTPLSNCEISFENTIKLSGDAGNTEFTVGNGGQIDLNARENVIITSVNQATRFFGSVNMGTTYPYVDNAIVGKPTLNKELTTKEYVDLRDGYLFSSIGNSSLGTQILTITDLLDGLPSPGSTLTIPGNFFVLGDSFHLSISGTCLFSGNPPNATVGNSTALNLTLSLRANGLLLSAIVIPTKNTGTSSFFEVEADFIIRSLGVSGTIATSFEYTYQIPSTTNFEGSRNSTIGSINTTLNNTLTCIAELDTGYNNASIQGIMAVLRKTH
jgi:hypothetical protein